MATGSVDPSSGILEREDAMTCKICLEILRSPKLLACSHTFCELCLQALALRHTSGTFPCPICREEIQVPEGGVSRLNNNPYLDRKDLERARDGAFCMKHIKQELDLYCVQCDLPICLKCKLTKHDKHETQDLSDAAQRAKTQLSTDMTRLQRCVLDVQQQVQQVTQEQQAVKDKHDELVTQIRNRQATLKAAVDKYTDDALTSLHQITADISHTHQADLDSLQDNLQQLTELQQRVQKAVNSEAGSELVTVAREMRCGRGSEQDLHKLTTKPITTVCRPVLQFSAATNATLQRMRDYVGSVAKMEMSVLAPEVRVVEQFRCRDDPDTDIYHVCPLTDGKVCVSYEPSMMRDEAQIEKFGADGKMVSTKKFDIPARITIAKRKNGAYMWLRPNSGYIYSYAKKCYPDMTKVCRLNNSLKGQADVTAEKILSEKPFKTEATREFTIQCDAHRACDVDASDQLFVVLEEAKAPDLDRKVRLYRRPQPDAIATYSPLVAPFQPSDVCFYRLGGEEVLLVADEVNDAIHVVSVQDGRLSFLRYLAPGCPLLVQPTALNTDDKGRLWVACRGGRILTCTPVGKSRWSRFKKTIIVQFK